MRRLALRAVLFSFFINREMLLFASLLLLTPFAPQAEDGPEFLAPSPAAKTSTAYWSKSAGDLRYM